jgi:hypothetical protein
MDTMTLPTKNRRTINVDGVKYHWVIGNRSDHRCPKATVQQSSGVGAKLFIDPIEILQPSDIASAIRFALVHGWNPSASGPEIRLGFDGSVESDRFVVRKADDPPYWKEKLYGSANTGQPQSPPKADQPPDDGLAVPLGTKAK